MEGRRLKKSVIYGGYVLAFLFVVGIIYLVEQSLPKPKLESDDTNYVTDTIIDNPVPVVAESTKIIRPYTDEDIKILKQYYNYKGDEVTQQNAIIVYNNTYMQSSGVCYGKENTFNVVAIADGTVTDIKDDNMLGKIVEVRHTNNLISLYQSLSEISVEKGQNIKSGEIIGLSGTSNLNKNLSNHLYFELIVNGITVNPEEYYDKDISEI